MSNKMNNSTSYSVSQNNSWVDKARASLGKIATPATTSPTPTVSTPNSTASQPIHNTSYSVSQNNSWVEKTRSRLANVTPSTAHHSVVRPTETSTGVVPGLGSAPISKAKTESMTNYRKAQYGANIGEYSPTGKFKLTASYTDIRQRVTDLADQLDKTTDEDSRWYLQEELDFYNSVLDSSDAFRTMTLDDAGWAVQRSTGTVDQLSREAKELEQDYQRYAGETGEWGEENPYYKDWMESKTKLSTAESNKSRQEYNREWLSDESNLASRELWLNEHYNWNAQFKQWQAADADPSRKEEAAVLLDRLTKGYGALAATEEEKAMMAEALHERYQAANSALQKANRAWHDATLGETTAESTKLLDAQRAAQASYDDIQKRVRAMGGYASNAGDIMEAVGQNVLSDLTSFAAWAVDVMDTFDVSDAVNVRPFVESVQEYRTKAQDAMSEVTIGMSPGAAMLTSLAPSIIEATATMGMAMLVAPAAAATTATVSNAARVATMSRTGQALNSARQILAGMASNPVYWTSFAHTAGMSYVDALNEGYDRNTALLFSTVNGALNAALEIGGIEALPFAEGEKTVAQIVKKIFTETGIEEGMEEVTQGIVERALSVLMLGENRDAFSAEDKEAVISLVGALEEFAGGYICSAILGPLGSASQIASARERQEYVKTLNQVNMALPESMRMGPLDGKTASNAELDMYREQLVWLSFANTVYNEMSAGMEERTNQKGSLRKKLYETVQAANPDRSVLTPLAEAIRTHPLYVPGQKVKDADKQAKLIMKILDGKDLTAYELRDLALDDKAVRAVFAERTGLAGIPVDGVSDIDLKREYVNRAVQAVRTIRDNQKAIRESADQVLQQNVAASTERAAAKSAPQSSDPSASTRESLFKKGRGTRDESTFESKKAEAKRHKRIETKGKTPEEVVQQVKDQSGVGDALPDYLTFVRNYFAGQSGGGEDVTPQMELAANEAYRGALTAIGLTDAEISAIMSVHSTGNRRSVALAEAKRGNTQRLTAELAAAEENVARIEASYLATKEEYDAAQQAVARARNSVTAAEENLRKQPKDKQLKNILRDSKNALKGAEAAMEEARLAFNKQQSRLFDALKDLNELRTSAGLEQKLVKGVNDGAVETRKDSTEVEDEVIDLEETEEPAAVQEEGTEEDGRVHESPDRLRDDSDSQGRPGSEEERPGAVRSPEEDHGGRDEGSVHETVQPGETAAATPRESGDWPSAESSEESRDGGSREAEGSRGAEGNSVTDDPDIAFLRDNTGNPDSLTIYDENSSTDETRVSTRALSLVRELAMMAGAPRVIYVRSSTGELYDRQGTPCNGLTTADGSIVVLVNPFKKSSSLMNPARTGMHEIFHLIARKDPLLPERIYDKLMSEGQSKTVKLILKMPRHVEHWNRFGKSALYVGWKGNTETHRRLEIRVLEEALCDAFAGRDAEYTADLLGVVEEFVEEKSLDLADLRDTAIEVIDAGEDAAGNYIYDEATEEADTARFEKEWRKAQAALKAEVEKGKKESDNLLGRYNSLLKAKPAPKPATTPERKAEQVEKAKAKLEETHKVNPQVESLPELIEVQQAKAQEEAEKPKSAPNTKVEEPPADVAEEAAPTPSEAMAHIPTAELQERRTELVEKISELTHKSARLAESGKTDNLNQLALLDQELLRAKNEFNSVVTELAARGATVKKNQTRAAFGIKQTPDNSQAALKELEEARAKLKAVALDNSDMPADYPDRADQSATARWKREGYDFMAIESKTHAVRDFLRAELSEEMSKGKNRRPGEIPLEDAEQHPAIRAVLRAAMLRQALNARKAPQHIKKKGERSEAVAYAVQYIIRRNWANSSYGVLCATLSGEYLNAAVEVSKALMFGDLYPVGGAIIMLDILDKHFTGTPLTEGGDVEGYIAKHKAEMPAYSDNQRVPKYVREAAALDSTDVLAKLKAQDRPGFPKMEGQQLGQYAFPELSDIEKEGLSRVLKFAEERARFVAQTNDPIARDVAIEKAVDAAAKELRRQNILPVEYGEVVEDMFYLVVQGRIARRDAYTSVLNIWDAHGGTPNAAYLVLRESAPKQTLPTAEAAKILRPLRETDTVYPEANREDVLAVMAAEDRLRGADSPVMIEPEEFAEELVLRLEEALRAKQEAQQELDAARQEYDAALSSLQTIREESEEWLHLVAALSAEASKSTKTVEEIVKGEKWQTLIDTAIAEAATDPENVFHNADMDNVQAMLLAGVKDFSTVARLGTLIPQMEDELQFDEDVIASIREHGKTSRQSMNSEAALKTAKDDNYKVTRFLNANDSDRKTLRRLQKEEEEAKYVGEYWEDSGNPKKGRKGTPVESSDDLESDDFIGDNLTSLELPISGDEDTYISEAETRESIRREVMDPKSKLNTFLAEAQNVRPKDESGRNEHTMGLVRRVLSGFWDAVQGMRPKGVEDAIAAGVTKEQAKNLTQVRARMRDLRGKPLGKKVKSESKPQLTSSAYSNMADYGDAGLTMEEKRHVLSRNLRQLGEAGRHYVFNTNDEVDIIGHRSTRIDNAYNLTNVVRSSSNMAQRMCLENMVDTDGRNIGASIRELTVITKKEKTATGTREVWDRERQVIFDELAYSRHELDRMSAKKRAEEDVIDYLANRPYLQQLTHEELSELYAEGSTEVVELFRRLQTAATLEDKPVLLDELNSPTPEHVQARIDEIVNDPANADLVEKLDNLYEAWDVYMRTYVVGSQISEEDYDYWRWLYPHYVPTHRAPATEKTRAKAAIDNFLKKHERFKGMPEEELVKLAEEGDKYALELCELYEAHRNAPNTPVERKLSTAGAISHGDTSLAPGATIKGAKGSYLPLHMIPDQFANLTMQYTRSYWYNRLTKTIIEEAMADYTGEFTEYVQFDWDYAAKQDKIDMVELEKMDEDIEHLLKQDPNDKQYYIYAWFNGTRLRAKVSAGVFEGLEATMHVPGKGRWDSFTRFAMKVGRTVTTPRKMMITGYNPFFALRNPARDLQTALINTSGNPFQFLRMYGKAWKQMYGNSENWQDFTNLGGASANFFQYSQGLGSRVLRGIKKDAKFGETATKQKSVGRKVLDAMGAFGEATESVTRFAEYLVTIENAKTRGEWTEEKAAAIKVVGIKNAAEITTDFGRSGAVGQFGNAFVLYLNANLQGLSKMYRVIAEQPTWQKKFGRFGRAAMVTLLPEIILYALLQGLDKFDEWDELSDYYKLNYFCFPVGDKRWLMIPKTRDWGAVIGNTVLMAGEVARGRDFRAAYQSWWETSLNASLMPPGLSDAIGVGTKLAFARNEDFAGRAIVPYGTEDGSAGLQYDEDTKWVAYQIATAGNNLVHALGFEEDKFSPAKIDYRMDSFMGNFWGGFFDLLTVGDKQYIEKNGVLATLLSEETADSIIRDMGDFLFVDSGKSAQVVGDYYDMVSALDKAVMDYSNRYGSAVDTQEYQIRAALNSKNGFVQEMRAVNQALREATTQEERDKLYALRNEIAAEALEFYEDCTSGKIVDPQLYLKYEYYGDRMYNEALRLDKYASEYNFHPDFTAPNNFSNPLDADGKTKFTGLTDEQKEIYLQFVAEEYGELTAKVLNSVEYKSLSPRAQANELKRAKDKAAEQARERMAEWLISNGVKPVNKTQAEIYADEQTAKHAFNRLINESWYSKETTDEVIRLADFGIELPNNTPSSYTHPNDNRYIFRLTDEEQDVYKNMRNGIYDGLVVYFMSLSYYNQLSDYDKAKVMSAVGRATTDLAEVNFKNWLVQNSVPQPKKTWETEEEKRIKNEYDELVKYFLAQAGIKY